MLLHVNSFGYLIIASAAQDHTKILVSTVYNGYSRSKTGSACPLLEKPARSWRAHTPVIPALVSNEEH